MNSVVTTLAPSFLIGSSSFLHATRTPIKSRMGSKLGSIRRMPLAALECLVKIPIDLLWEKCCDLSSAFVFE